MSSEAVEPAPPPPTAEILPAKSEDKLEIEKEEAEDKAVEEKTTEDATKDTADQEDKEKEDNEKTDGEKDKDAGEEKGDAEEKDSTTEEKKKKLRLPKVNLKTPKVITDIRSKSKERKKKKKEEKEAKGEEETAEDKKEEEKDEEEKAKETEGEEKKDSETEKEADAATEVEESEGKSEKKGATTRVKDALENVSLPKMPKIHKPAFLKKKADKSEEKTEDKSGEDSKDGEEKTDEDKPEEEVKETTEGDEKKEGEEQKEDEKEDKEEKEDELNLEEGQTKKSLLDSIKSFKPPKVQNPFSKGKKKECSGEEKGEEEGEKLLEGEEKKEDEGKEEDKEEKEEIVEKEGEEEQAKKRIDGAKILKTLRHAASGVPALFREDKDVKEVEMVDIELGETKEGEKQELLDKVEEGDNVDSNKVELQEIKLDHGAEKDADQKSVGSEKKDPEKGEKEGETPKKKKCNKLRRFHQRFMSLDDQQKMGVVGILGGLFFLLLVIIIAIAAACTDGDWSNVHRYVEGGKYIETHTSCGTIWGRVDAQNRFSFTGIPYSVQVDRFESARLPDQIDECGDEIQMPVNTTSRCIRRNAMSDIVGEEDCLYLDVFTPSVMYSAALPVIVYLPGDNAALTPSSELAQAHGVVFVTVNVRQGLLGFLSHTTLSDAAYPKTSGNYAVGDLITALQWLQLNVAHFGGDPEAVTLFGHVQGASLATALTAVAAADGLYSRVWATGGTGGFSNSTLAESSEQWTPVLKSICNNNVNLDCLRDAEPEALIEAMDQEWEAWGGDELPKAGDMAMTGLLTIDTLLVKEDVNAVLARGVKVPVVIGATAQSSANWENYQYLAWNNTDLYQEMVEGSLGSWDVDLPVEALSRYNSSDNWLDYMTMVSDVRTVCPLAALARRAGATMYVATAPSAVEGLGLVADASADVAAILSSTAENDDSFSVAMRDMFYRFVRGGELSTEELHMVGQEGVSAVENLDNCQFWRETEPPIVPTYSKLF